MKKNLAQIIYVKKFYLILEMDIFKKKSSTRSRIKILSYEDGNVYSWKIQRMEILVKDPIRLEYRSIGIK